MNRIVFLLEEYSMCVLFEGLMPRLFPGVPYLCVSHDGKKDLEKSFPRKLKAWNEPGVRFCVIRDNDGADCRVLKQHLVELCPEDRRERCLIRIACQTLEAWCFGDPDALARAYQRPELGDIGRKAGFRDPDTISNPSGKLQEFVEEFQKVSGARALGRELTRQNASTSFQALLAGIDRLAAEVAPHGGMV